MVHIAQNRQSGYDRKRRAHAKSRKGCGNCKLRRIKCDESRPKCKKCVSYGVACDYDGLQSALNLNAQGAFQIELSPTPESTKALPSGNLWDLNLSLDSHFPSMTSTMTAMIDTALSNSPRDARPESPIQPSYFHENTSWSFTESHFDILSRFQDRTIKTIGNSHSVDVYRDCISRLAFTHPFLMHMVLSITLMHDAHLALSQSCELSARQWHLSLCHWNTATTHFNYVLSQPIIPSSRDAIWAAGAILSTIVFAYVESPIAEQPWPLKPSEPNDLNWLKLSDGKKAIWQIADPTRSDSVFAPLAQKNHCSVCPEWLDQSHIPANRQHLKELFDITPDCTITNNIYCLPLLVLCRIERLPPTFSNILSLLSFMAFMKTDYLHAVENKDPRAVMLLGWWFKKLETMDLWWVQGRARLEHRAIRLWLERQGLEEMFDVLYMPPEEDNSRTFGGDNIQFAEFIYAMKTVC